MEKMIQQKKEFAEISQKNLGGWEGVLKIG